MAKIIITGLISLFFVSFAYSDTVSAPTATFISPIKPVVRVLPPTLVHIAYCESHDVAGAKNPSSSASGRFQFVKSSWNYYGKELWGDKLATKDKFNFDDNTDLAIYVYQRNGTSDWNASKSCWSRLANLT